MKVRWLLSKTIFIDKPAQFNYQECLRMMDRNELECLYQIHDQVVIKPFKFGGDQVMACVTEEKEHLRIDLSKDVDAKCRDAIDQYFTDWLDLKTDLSVFYSKLEHHPQFAYMATEYRGLRLIGIPDLFECLCWCIIGQQINLNFAFQVKRRFVERYGEEVISEHGSLYIFPTPEEVANCDREELLAMKFSRNKADYMIGIAKAFEDNAITRDGLMKLNHQERIDHLTSIRGIGQWTANYALMKSLKDPECIPYGDSGLNAAMKAHGFDKDRQVIDKVFEPFENWKSYLSFYLWRSLGEV